MFLAKWQSLVFCVLCSGATLAAERTALYQAEVSAEQTQQQWQREALQQVLVRVTGRPELIEQAQVRSELNNAGSYIKQFEAARSEQGNRVKVLLDAQRIQQLLQQLQVPIWGGQRPELLFWIVEQQDSTRRFVNEEHSPWLQSLTLALSEQALPFILPAYDMDDVLNLNETDAWSGVWAQINQASFRYQPDEVVVLLLESDTSGTTPVWRLTALRQHEQQVLRDELEAESVEALMAQYTAKLSQQLAQQYAILLDPTQLQHAVLQINNTASFADVVAVERRLSALLGVNKTRIVSQGPQQTRFELELQMTPEQLLQSLQFESQFKPVLSDSPFEAAPNVFTAATNEITSAEPMPLVVADDTAVPADTSVVQSNKPAEPRVLAVYEYIRP